MTNFEKLINTIIGENAIQSTLAPKTPTPPSTTTQKAPTPPSTTTPNNPQEDEQLIDLVKQKMQDVKFKEALMKALNNTQQTPQQNTSTTVPVTNTPVA